MRPEIFVSYSHRDSDLVVPIVALLRASEALVFRDADQLIPGKKWRQQLDSAISDSTTVLVFWCDHSRSSEEVKKEYTAAIQQRKDLLPLLLDSTPLPDELAEYQYIDFRAAFPKGHAPPMMEAKRARRNMDGTLGGGAPVFPVFVESPTTSQQIMLAETIESELLKRTGSTNKI